MTVSVPTGALVRAGEAEHRSGYEAANPLTSPPNLPRPVDNVRPLPNYPGWVVGL